MTVEKLKIPTTKGNISAVLETPEKETDSLAVLCPGYLDTKDYSHLVELSKVLVQEGFSVIRFDPIGIWESEGSIADYTTSNYLSNIKDIIDFELAKHPYRTILLGGHSRGGMVSLIYASKDPRVSMVLGIMPSSNRTMAGRRRDDWQRTGISVSSRDLPENPEKQREFRVPFSHVIDRDKYDTVESVKNINGPVFLIAGAEDIKVLPEFVQEIYDNANDPKKMKVIPNIGHDYRHNKNEINIVNTEIIKLIKG